MNTIDGAKDKQQIWNSAKVIDHYLQVEDLQKPELAILHALKDRLPTMRMLDLGIGGGRTTVHFEPEVYEYLGSDYAENMVEASRKRFPNAGPRTKFEVVDATNMAGIPDAYYDFILFSFNGIDCVAPEDRDNVFLEARRVGKPGAFFAFSTHNVQYIPNMYRLRLRDNLREFIYQFYRIPLLIWHNGLPGKYRNKQTAVFRNGVEQFALNLHYIHPEYQVAHLKELGYKNIRVFTYKTGEAVEHSMLHTLTANAWLYYLCEI